MPKQTYFVWQSGPNYRFRWNGKSYQIPWDLQRQRELYCLLGRWFEDAQPTDPRQVKTEDGDALEQ